jgi:hypothetical protein
MDLWHWIAFIGFILLLLGRGKTSELLGSFFEALALQAPGVKHRAPKDPSSAALLGLLVFAASILAILLASAVIGRLIAR